MDANPQALAHSPAAVAWCLLAASPPGFLASTSAGLDLAVKLLSVVSLSLIIWLNAKKLFSANVPKLETRND